MSSRPDEGMETVPLAALAAESDAATWDAFVRAQAGAVGYHEWAWRNVFRTVFGHEPLYLIARRGRSVVGILPLVQIKSLVFGRTLTSLPFLNYGGIVAVDDATTRVLVDEATSLCRERRCTHVELRHIGRQLPSLPCKQHKVTMLLPLGPGMWEAVDRKVRNQVRKAQKSGLTSHSGGLELLSDFYAVFARNMRDLGTPVYDRRFFEEVLRTFPDRAGVQVVRLGDTPVAAALTYRTRGRVEVPWASSIRDYNNLCPNHLLYWSLIELAAEQGCDTFDFGRSTPGEGTFKFKEQWGAKPEALHWEYVLTSGTTLPNTSPTNPKFHFAVELWKRLPLPVATHFGPRIVRAIP